MIPKVVPVRMMLGDLVPSVFLDRVSQAGVDLPVGHHLHLPKLANGLREPHQRVPRDPKAPRARKVPRAVVARVARVNQAKIIR